MTIFNWVESAKMLALDRRIRPRRAVVRQLAMVDEVVAPSVRPGQDGAVQAGRAEGGMMGDDREMAFALGPLQQDLVAVAGAAWNPGKHIAFHAGHHRARAQ